MSYYGENLPKDKHVFLGRKGGISKDKYASLNISCICQDDKQNIDINRQIAAEKLGGNIDDLLFLRQMASTDVAFISEPSQEKVTADGAVTKAKGIILGIKTADCLPVLMADYQNGVIGAAHAGWRGAIRGVVENTLKLMIEKGAKIENIAVALGPCIQQKSFEVGMDVWDECVNLNAEYNRFFVEGKDKQHFQFDLEGLVKYRLQKFGVNNVSASGVDTYSDEENYFSFRRNTHQRLVCAAKDFPCHVSLIRL
ncbi:MAG: peptidoglycan editing factor PgeF [Alphaproteobacteria bacterium]|nr:peptidoglycan editing factor PgeF [Alphaproteobacteria bacterium]